MKLPRCLTKRSTRVHKTAFNDQYGRGDGNLTFCNYAVLAAERLPQEKDRWDGTEEQMGLCIKCRRKVALLVPAP